jgi:hypothetical protein
VPGTKNNLPATLTNSSVLTTASNDAATGISAGTFDQISHADVNVSGHDCGFCHTQAGASTAAGVQGKEWAQAVFHSSFTATAPLDMVSGRCSNCHLNLKPGAGFTAYSHAALGPTGQDCSGCHAAPPARSDWLGAAAAPAFIVVGGFTISQPPAAAPLVQAGVANLPHPAVGTAGCSACHLGGVGGKGAIGYDHLSALVNTACNSCHEAGSDLVGTAWNNATTAAAAAGDTRPFTLASVRATYKSNTSTETTPNHFYLDKAGAQVDCGWCHVKPAANGLVTTGAAYKAAWVFKHPSENKTYNFCYQCHPNGPPQ